MHHTKDEALSRTLHYMVSVMEDLRQENAQMQQFLQENFRQYNRPYTHSQDANFATLRAFVEEFDRLSKTNRGHSNLLNEENPYDTPREPRQARRTPTYYGVDNPF